jgi:hypothetical protein
MAGNQQQFAILPRRMPIDSLRTAQQSPAVRQAVLGENGLWPTCTVRQPFPRGGARVGARVRRSGYR